MTRFSSKDREASAADGDRPASLVPSSTTEPFADEDRWDAIAGLSQRPKSIPPRFFYDDLGSELFEQICDLSEYYPTRTEASILERYSAEIAQTTGACEIVELGSGSSRKTRSLLSAYQSLGQPVYYQPIDVSAGILEQSARSLRDEYPGLHVCPIVGTYDRALKQLAPASRRTIVFLGSSLGNFTPEECERFFERVGAALAPGGYFLLGIDLQKPVAIVEAAYNDARGVTAAFNLNVLRHLNRRFEGNFDLDAFEHLALYNRDRHQIEMYLVSQRSQEVCLHGLDLSLSFQAGERILTEISRKFDLDELQADLRDRGLAPVRTWTDEKGWFGLILCQKQTDPSTSPMADLK